MAVFIDHTENQDLLYRLIPWQLFGEITDVIDVPGMTSVVGMPRWMLEIENRAELSIWEPVPGNPEGQNCDDMTPVMFYTPKNGKHINFGRGVCLTTEEIELLPRTNPITQLPFTDLENFAANVLLDGGRVWYMGGLE